MPEVRRHALPRAVFRHLLDRVEERAIPADQLGLFVCGEGELVKTVLSMDQRPFGEEVV